MYYDPLSVAFSYGVSKALTPTGGAGVNRTLISEVESFGESNAVAKTVSWEANIADDVASYNKTADPYLDYHGARYYIPWLCRWCACDPLESKYAGWSSYNYCTCNPVNHTDSTGMGNDDDRNNIKVYGQAEATHTTLIEQGATHNDSRKNIVAGVVWIRWKVSLVDVLLIVMLLTTLLFLMTQVGNKKNMKNILVQMGKQFI